MTATGGYESKLPAYSNIPGVQLQRGSSDPHRTASLFDDINFRLQEQDLNFREDDTIAMIEHVEY